MNDAGNVGGLAQFDRNTIPLSHALLPAAIGDGTTWGRYAPAIERWERIIGRPAPHPVEHAPAGPRLATRFVEWLMGLPEGHVTSPDAGLTRNQQMRALGNAVAPQQGAAAITHLLTTRSTTR